MNETPEAPQEKSNTRRPLIIGAAGAALVIAVALWLSNASLGTAATCPVNDAARAAIDAAAGGELAALNATADGRGYADMAFQDDTGRPMTLADFSGKPLLVNFWTTWCGPCREEMPDLDALAARFDSEDFQVVPINLDLGSEGVIKAQKFLDDENLPNLPLYADPSFAAFDRLKANGVALGLPATLLLDGSGCELAVLQGPAAWNSADGVKVIDALIAAPKT